MNKSQVGITHRVGDLEIISKYIIVYLNITHRVGDLESVGDLGIISDPKFIIYSITHRVGDLEISSLSTKS